MRLPRRREGEHSVMKIEPHLFQKESMFESVLCLGKAHWPENVGGQRGVVGQRERSHRD